MSRPVILWIGIATGAVLGILVAVISRAISKRLKKGDFWTELPQLTRALASGSDSDEFLRVYGRLLKLLCRYLAGNAVQLAASFAPVVATVVLCGPAVMEVYNHRAVALAIHPPHELKLDLEDEQFETNAGGSLIEPIPRSEKPGKAVTAAGEFPFESVRRNNAWCTGDWGQLGMSLLGFDAQLAPAGGGFLILRPDCGDLNPCWPYLNDLEFLFYVAITAGSGVTAVVLKKRGH